MKSRSFLFSLAALLGLTSITLGQQPREVVLDMRLKGNVTMSMGGRSDVIESETSCVYSNIRKGNVVTVSFKQLAVKAVANKKPSMDIVMNGEKFIDRIAKVEHTFKSAPEPLQVMMRDSYQHSFAEVTVDADGFEAKRKLIAKPGARSLLDNGQLANTRLFHPGFPKDKTTWKAPAAVSNGNGLAKGTLTYTVKKRDGNRTMVNVSGRLTASGKQGAAEIKEAAYVVTGQQTYDSDVGEWQTGKLKMVVSMVMAIPGSPEDVTGKGTILVSLNPWKASGSDNSKTKTLRPKTSDKNSSRP